MELHIKGELLDLQALKYIVEKMGLSCNIKYEYQDNVPRNWALLEGKEDKIMEELCIEDSQSLALTTLIKEQSIIPLIKFVRSYNKIGFGLKESKDYVESILEGRHSL